MTIYLYLLDIVSIVLFNICNNQLHIQLPKSITRKTEFLTDHGPLFFQIYSFKLVCPPLCVA